ncbi:MAG: O-antigen polysaccharide polymerase Wzy [Nitrospiraceae bacterium]
MSQSHVTTPKLILLVVSALVAALAIVNSVNDRGLDPDWPETVALVWAIWTATYVGTTWRALGTPYLLSSSYVIALCMFHLGLPLPAAVGWLTAPDLTRGVDGFWMQQSAWCTLMALSAFGIGVALSLKTAPSQEMALEDAIAHRTEALSTAYSAGLGLFAAALCFLAMLIAQVGNPLAYSRMDFFHAQGDMRGLALFLMTLPSSAVLLVIGARTLFQYAAGGAVALFSLGMLLLSGYRSAAMFPLLVGTILWTKTGRHIPVVLAVGMVGIIMIAIPTIAILRASGSYDSMSSAKVSESIEQADSTNTFVELGSTAAILGATLRFVPETDPYRYGLTYVHALRETIPNLSLTARESDRDRFLKDGASQAAMIHLAPSDWLTYKLEPLKFYNGEGVGFSAIAEPYLNFGYPGVVVCFALLGFLLGRLDQKPLWAEPKWLVFCGAVFWPLVRTVRNDINNFTKPMLFMYLILAVWFGGLSLFRDKSAQKQVSHAG